MDFKEFDEVVFIGDEDSHYGLEFGEIYKINYISKSNNQNVKINNDWVNGFSLADPKNLEPWQALRLLQGGRPVYIEGSSKPFSICNNDLHHGMSRSGISLNSFLSCKFNHPDDHTRINVTMNGEKVCLSPSQIKVIKRIVSEF